MPPALLRRQVTLLSQKGWQSGPLDRPGNLSVVTRPVGSSGVPLTHVSFRDLLGFAQSLAGWWRACCRSRGGPRSRSALAHVGRLSLAPLCVPSHVAKRLMQGTKAHQAQAQKRAPCLTSSLPQGVGGGEGSPTRWEFETFSVSLRPYCFSLPPEGVTAAPPAGPAGVHSTASAGVTRLGRELTKAPRTPTSSGWLCWKV